MYVALSAKYDKIVSFNGMGLMPVRQNGEITRPAHGKPAEAGFPCV
jgi:hypothetical protein